MRYLTEMDGDEIAVRQQAAELAIKAMGITFTVYHEQDGSIDRAWMAQPDGRSAGVSSPVW